MVARRTPTVALVGNPNTGKTTLFNALAGMNQRVGNYPGVTVETKKGRLRHGEHVIDIIDLPGTYSLAPRSPDEMVAVDVILGNSSEPRPDLVITIVDASNLERNLYLMTQVLELGVPVIVALNMIDVATGQGLNIDVDKLSQQLGVPVVPLQANRGKGLTELKQAIVRGLNESRRAEPLPFPEAFESSITCLKERTASQEPTFLLRRLLIDAGGHAEARLTQKYGPGLAEEVTLQRQRLVQAGFKLAGIEAHVRYPWIRKATTGCIQRPAQRPVTWTDRIDRVLTHRVWGTFIFFLLMFTVFTAIFVIAEPAKVLINLFNSWLAGLASEIPPGPLQSLVVDGIIKGVGSVLVFVPQIMLLFAIIAVLEDCGYMARAAFLMDRLMARAGLNGKSFIPLLSSLACAVPGILSARVIENRRDRLATILVAPLMSCSARLPVYSLLIGAFLPISEFGWWVPGLAFFGLYMIGIVLAPLIAYLLKSTILRGEAPVFVMEMPLYKMPSLLTVLRRALDAGWLFTKRAGTFILASMIIVWALLYFPAGDFEQRIEPLEAQVKIKKDELERVENEATPEHPRKQEIKAIKDEIEPVQKQINELRREWKAQSYLGQVGQWVEPAVEPLGWDWRIGMAAIASFPAREVMVGTLGIIFGEGEGDIGEDEYRGALEGAIHEARWPNGRPLFTVPVALSIMVFFALCCQCVSTLAVIRRETGTWRWPIFTFVYMTVLAYLGALATYQVGRLWS